MRDDKFPRIPLTSSEGPVRKRPTRSMAKLSAKRRTSQPATKGGERASMNHFFPILGKPNAGRNFSTIGDYWM